jgi:hypothetical protein
MNTDHSARMLGAVASTDGAIVVDCNPFYVTLHKGSLEAVNQAFPLNRVNISFDTKNNQLKLEILPT